MSLRWILLDPIFFLFDGKNWDSSSLWPQLVVITTAYKWDDIFIYIYIFYKWGYTGKVGKGSQLDWTFTSWTDSLQLLDGCLSPAAIYFSPSRSVTTIRRAGVGCRWILEDFCVPRKWSSNPQRIKEYWEDHPNFMTVCAVCGVINQL